MTTASAPAPPAASRLTKRWPTALAIVQAGGAIFIILGPDGEAEFAAGIAAMACIYMAAYAAGSKVAAWPAYPVVFAIWVILELVGIDAKLSMTTLLVGLWIVAIARRRTRDGRWFVIQTSGMVFFGGLTIETASVTHFPCPERITISRAFLREARKAFRGHFS